MTVSKVYFIRDEHGNYFDLGYRFFTDEFNSEYDNRRRHKNKKEIKDSLEYITLYYPGRKMYVEEVITTTRQKSIKTFLS